MNITQEPAAAEVLCYQCSGIGKLRVTFGDPPQWSKCGKCGGTGKLHRSGGSFVGALPDLSAVVLEERRGKRKNFEQCGVHASPGKSGERHGSIPCVVTGTDIRVGLASDHCSIPLCQAKVAMIHEGGRYCAQHGLEILK